MSINSNNGSGSSIGNQLKINQSKATIQAANNTIDIPSYLRLIGYGRVSTDEQADPEKTSLENQQDKNRAYADNIGAVIVATFNDDYTGTELSRPELNKALRMLANGEADGIVCMKVDRMARSVAVFMTLWTLFTNSRKELHFADSGKADMAKIDSLILTIMKASMSQEERKVIIERMMAGKYKVLNKGEIHDILNISGRLPYGFIKKKYHDPLGNLTGKEVVLDPEKADIIRQMYTLAAYGYYDGHPLSAYEITRVLNTHRISLSDFQDKKGFHPTTVTRILHNPMYAGVYIYNRLIADPDGVTTLGKKKAKSHRSMRPKEEWLMFDLPEELRIVDIETWNIVQNNLKQNKTNGKRLTKMPFLLNGHFKCGSCGRAMTSTVSMSNQTGKYKTKRVTSKEYYAYRRYRCTSRTLARAKAFPTSVICEHSNKSVNATIVEHLVWEWIKWLLSDPDNINDAIGDIRQKSEYELSPKKQQLEAAFGRLHEIDKTMGKIVKRMASEDDEYLYASYKVQYDELRKEYKDLTAIREQLEEEIAGMEITETVVDEIWSLYDQIRNQILTKDATFENKRFLLNLFKVKAVFHYVEEPDTHIPHRIIRLECVLGESAERWFDLETLPKTSTNGEEQKPSVDFSCDHLDYCVEKPHKVVIHMESNIDLEAFNVTEEFHALFQKSIQAVFVKQEKA